MGLKGVYYIESLILHRHPECFEGCINILCEEWGRSRTARSVMLEKSCDEFPFNVALVEKSTDGVEVIGHSRLCLVAGCTKSAFVESVVIKKSKRGKGFGRILMNETELHASSLGITTLYLTTTDKQDFYTRMGFSFCQPIVSLGSASKLLNRNEIQSIFGCHGINSQTSENQPTIGPQELPVTPSHVPSTIPPPPLLFFPPQSGSTSSEDNSTLKQNCRPQIAKVDVYWMKKSLGNK